MNILSEHMKETIDRIDGFLTGRLIVDLEKQTVELETVVRGRTSYLTLTDLDQIEVRNIDEYIPVTIKEALGTMAAGTKDWPLFAGLYARVKVHKSEKPVVQLNDEPSQTAGTVSEVKQNSKFNGITIDFNKTINEHRIAYGLAPLDNPRADELFCPLVQRDEIR